jgi:hypothetical protein
VGESEGDEVVVSFVGEAVGEVVKVSAGEIVASLSIVSGGGFSVSCPFSLPVMLFPCLFALMLRKAVTDHYLKSMIPWHQE